MPGRRATLTQSTAALLLAVTSIAGTAPGPAKAEVLRSVGSLPPDIVGVYREPAAFQQVTSGQYLVFDRRAHAVYGVDAARTTTWKLVDIGEEAGQVLDPLAFDSEPGGSFVVADAPAGRERIQVFSSSGWQLGGFTLPGRHAHTFDRRASTDRPRAGFGSPPRPECRPPARQPDWWLLFRVSGRCFQVPQV